MNPSQPSRRQALSGLIASFFALFLPAPKTGVADAASEEGPSDTILVDRVPTPGVYSYDCEDGGTIATTILVYNEFNQVVGIQQLECESAS